MKPSASKQPQKEYTPHRPAKWALKRVPDHLPIPKTCCYCQSRVVIKHHTEVYGKVYNEWPWLYGCTKCDAQVGMHPFTNLPLGTLADRPTRQARILFKNRFNTLWKGGAMDRTKAYRKLAKTMNIPFKDCHIGYFSIADCERAQQALAVIKGSM